jgi:DNA-binding PadR family transcriptional regulator
MGASSKFVEKLRKRVIQNFMDILILTEMQKGHPLSGYDVIGFLHHKYGILVSSGTVYSLMYSLERDGLIKGIWNNRKRMYELDENAEQNIKTIIKTSGEIENLLRNISMLNSIQPSLVANARAAKKEDEKELEKSETLL